MIIAYPKYFEMPVIRDDDFEQLTDERFMYRGEEMPSDGNDKKDMYEDEFEETDEEYIENEMRNREYYF